MMRKTFLRMCRRAPMCAAAIGFLLLLPFSSASPAPAELKGISITPSAPTPCNRILITVAGELPDPCYEVVGEVIRGPEPIPCMRPTPCPSRIYIEITVREPNPLLDRPCPAIVTPYTRSFSFRTLPPGEYTVLAHERVVPFSADSTDTTVSESFASADFTVRTDSTCPPGQGCLAFAPVNPSDSCTATVSPGGTACLDLTLMNTQPVGGLQTTIDVTRGNRTTPADPFIRSVSVEPTRRAAGFQVGWTVEGSKTRLILYSTTGATIAPGDGPVVRICYSVATDTPPQVFWITVSETIIADPAGGTTLPCLTLAVPFGTICVTGAGSACDLNGDGVSDVLDVIRLVRCALRGGNDSTSACPDSVAARADCNGDGSVDIRDVICCVRKIVAIPGSPWIGTGADAPAVGHGNAVGFEGGFSWINAVEGKALVRVDAGEDWGGAQFSIDPRGAPVRVRGLKLDGSSSTEQLEWAVDHFGVAHAVLYTTGGGTRPARSYRIQVTLERLPSSPPAGSIELRDARAGTAAGTAAQISLFDPYLQVTGAPVAAPALLGARPNPSAGETEIGFVLPASARVTLRVYDVAGRLVRTLIDGSMPEGVNRVRWGGTDDLGRAARSGIYFTKLHVGGTIRSERILLLR